MGLTKQAIITLQFVNCARCYMPFGLTTKFQQDRLDDHKQFKCPLGHINWYPGKSSEEKLQEQLTRTKRELDYAEVRIKKSLQKTKEVKKSRAAIKGQLTKTKNRLSAGLCPCCNRNFVSLGRHIKTKHLEYKPEEK